MLVMFRIWIYLFGRINCCKSVQTQCLCRLGNGRTTRPTYFEHANTYAMTNTYVPNIWDITFLKNFGTVVGIKRLTIESSLY